MENLTEEVPVIQPVLQLASQIDGKVFEPIRPISWKCDIERNYVVHLLSVDGPIAYGGSGGRKTMQKRLLSLLGCALKIGAGSRRKDRRQILLGFFDAVVGHSQHKMVFEALVVVVESLWRM